MKNALNRIWAISVLVIFVVACSEDPSTPKVTKKAAPAVSEPVITRTEGSCSTVFEGTICTWSESRGDELLAFGATVPMVTVENAPPDAPLVMPPVTYARIAVPENVKSATGVDHLGINWEAFGHPPGTFMTPHFDFHFYTQTGEEIEAIDCTDQSKPEALPAGYFLPDIGIPEMNMTLVGLCVPGMGMHGMLEAEANNAELFDATMIVGYYHQQMIFFEPMVAKALLDRREDFSVPMPEIPGRAEGVATPVAFKAHYDAGQDAYQFRFSMNVME